jgi:hypothetical protein
MQTINRAVIQKRIDINPYLLQLRPIRHQSHKICGQAEFQREAFSKIRSQAAILIIHELQANICQEKVWRL